MDEDVKAKALLNILFSAASGMLSTGELLIAICGPQDRSRGEILVAQARQHLRNMLVDPDRLSMARCDDEMRGRIQAALGRL